MTTKSRRGEGTRRRERKVLYEQLRLQAEILCDSYGRGKNCAERDSNDRQRELAVLSRMFGLMLEVTKSERKINTQTRQVLADHFMDSPYAAGDEPSVELGGPDDRNHLHISGSFDIEELSKRLVWSSERHKEMIDA